MMDLHAVDKALSVTKQYLLSSQMADGSWAGPVEADPRNTAFYLNTQWAIGCGHDDRTCEMEAYLEAVQLECGGWEAWPGGGPDVEVTAACVLALREAATDAGKNAAKAASRWLVSKPTPPTDLFWRGYLAVSGELNWTDLPYFTPRLVSNPDWLHPNIYDLSFIRVAVVSLALIQADKTRSLLPRSSENQLPNQAIASEDQRFTKWKGRWVAKASRPTRGLVPFLSSASRLFDSLVSNEKHRTAAIRWLLDRQESDGSFFSSAQMTSMAILTLHTIDKRACRDRIEAAQAALNRWQAVDHRGRRQQFTDSTNWDTGLCLDVLRRLGVPRSHSTMLRARNYLLSRQHLHIGDWSHRAGGVTPGGWSFQRSGKWYPDVDDTALIVMALLDLDDAVCEPAARRGIEWILGMQGSDGGWASWDRDDRSWVQFRGAGPWFARDLACADITARAVLLLSRVISGQFAGLEDLVRQAKSAVRRGMDWLKRHREGSTWFGAWFTHYLYGTGQVLEAYREAGIDPDSPQVRSARDWIVSVANPDGAYGEAPDSGRKNGFVAGASTPFHTACALSALVNAGAARHPAARRAAEWLISRQNANGTWTSKGFFAAGIPGLWYADFTLTPTCLAARSLASFRQEGL